MGVKIENSKIIFFISRDRSLSFFNAMRTGRDLALLIPNAFEKKMHLLLEMKGAWLAFIQY
ncbi:MAG TPA: hypothetical protein DCQ31_19060 [Bacteroidales bacterium]|nr:hypothetical protein [Bacteroidales bacterium]